MKDFWSDLDQLSEGRNHYTGVLTLEDVPAENLARWDEDHWIIDAKSYAPHYVVDGQQRLTTSIILIQSITEVVSPDTKINYATVDDIRRKFIFESKDEGISRSYIFGYDKDNPSYEFLKTNIFGEPSDNSHTVQETIYTYNLERAKEYFRNKLEPLGLPEIEALYKKLTQHFLFNIYSISEDIDVFVAFETMNNRGKPLSHLELLKNRLIYLSTKLNSEQYERSRLRHTINEAWKTIHHNLGRNKLNPLDDDRFLQSHFALYFGESVLKEHNIARYNRRGLHFLENGLGGYYKNYLLEKKFTPKGLTGNDEDVQVLTAKEVYDYVTSLKQSVELWYYILNPEHSHFDQDTRSWLQRLNRLGIFPAAPLILIFLQKEHVSSARDKFLRALENKTYLETLLNFVGYIYPSETNYYKLASDLKNDEIDTHKVVKIVEQEAEEYRSQPELLKSLKKDFAGKGFYPWRSLKYFFYEYEQSLRDKSKAHEDKLNWKDFVEESRDFETIEHIYPQRPGKSCWTENFNRYSPKERNVLRHSLGNLVPLSKAKNSSFQNKCFQDKIGNAKDTIGFRYGSYAENELTQFDDWTAQHIVERGVKLLTFMEKRWRIQIGDKKEKIAFLGLDFVANRSSE